MRHKVHNGTSMQQITVNGKYIIQRLFFFFFSFFALYAASDDCSDAIHY